MAVQYSIERTHQTEGKAMPTIFYVAVAVILFILYIPVVTIMRVYRPEKPSRSRNQNWPSNDE